MANEITVSVSLAYNNPITVTSPVGRAITGALFNSLAAIAPSGSTISVATTGTAIPLGQITSPFFAWIRNLDPTNYVQIYTSQADKILGANPFAQLFPGELCLVPLGSNNNPYAVANTAAVDLEYFLTSR
jgi:hypothetical protein